MDVYFLAFSLIHIMESTSIQLNSFPNTKQPFKLQLYLHTTINPKTGNVLDGTG